MNLMLHSVRACVRACICVCVRARVCVCVHVSACLCVGVFSKTPNFLKLMTNRSKRVRTQCFGNMCLIVMFCVRLDAGSLGEITQQITHLIDI